MEYKRIGSTQIQASILGFGDSAFNNFFKDSQFDLTESSVSKVKQIVRTALDLGINYFDDSPWYGNAQPLLAAALKDVPRSSYYLATKVGRYNSDKEADKWFDFSYQTTLQSVELSLKIFNTDYFDLVQVHDFEYADGLDQIVNETLPALAKLQQQGQVRYIGINSYSIERLKQLLELSSIKIDTVLTFAHLTLDDTSLAEHVQYFRDKGVGILNASPLSMGLYTPIGPPDWHRAPHEVKQAVRSAFDYCQARNVTLEKLALHFSACSGLADITIVSNSCEKFLKENVAALNELTPLESKVLAEIQEKIFKHLNYKGYGDYDVIKYREKIQQLKSDQSLLSHEQ